MTNDFWTILGLGLAIPCTVVVILNLIVKVKNPENYELDFYKLFFMYFVALIGWAVTFGLK